MCLNKQRSFLYHLFIVRVKRLHLVVHHSVCNLTHLTKNRQGVWEPILGTRLWLVTAELTLWKKNRCH